MKASAAAIKTAAIPYPAACPALPVAGTTELDGMAGALAFGIVPLYPLVAFPPIIWKFAQVILVVFAV